MIRDRYHIGKVSCMKGQVQDRWVAGYVSQDRSDVGQEGCRTGEMKERMDAGKEG